MARTKSERSCPSAIQVALAVLACTPLLASAAVGNYVYFIDRDSGGGALYGGSPVWVRNPMACQDSCIADPTCFGWTFVIPNDPTWDGPCYLKGYDNCDVNTLAQEREPNTIASAIIGDSCYVTCGTESMMVGPDICYVIRAAPAPSTIANRYRRDIASRMREANKKNLCPKGQTACIISTSADGGYECVDTSEELASCGACGNDCTEAPGVQNVRCSQGQCIVTSCSRGFEISSSGVCVPKSDFSDRRKRTKAILHAVQEA